MADVVFALCALTSLACGVLLWRGYQRSRARLLMWSSLCFAGLFVNNALLLVPVPQAAGSAFETWRLVPALVGVALLLYGLVWDAEQR